MTTQEKLSKYVIKAALKDLQKNKRYKTLEDLRYDLETELIEEGYRIDEDDRKKISLAVEEEGFTGRFAIDDIILRKIKNKKYWPLITVCIAVIVFLVTQVSGALIEYYVQKPLNGSDTRTASAPAVIAAFFQLPSIVNGKVLEFNVTIQNQLDNESLNDLVLFASVEDSVKKIDIEPLPPRGEKAYSEKLDIKSMNRESICFNAYIIGKKVSFKSNPVTIKRINKDQVAVVDMSKPVERGGSGEPVTVAFSETGSDRLAGDIIEGLKNLAHDDPRYKSSLEILKALARSESEKARKFLDVENKGK